MIQLSIEKVRLIKNKIFLRPYFYISFSYIADLDAYKALKS